MNKQWYSICSIHRTYQQACSMCNAGEWVDEDDPERIADKALWQSDPDAWREKHKNDSLDFTDREGNAVFPFPNLNPGPSTTEKEKPIDKT